MAVTHRSQGLAGSTPDAVIMKTDEATISDQYKKLREGVPALRDEGVLRSPHFPHIFVGFVDATVTFSIAEHEKPSELGPRMMGALYEAQQELEKSIKRLAENITGLR